MENNKDLFTKKTTPDHNFKWNSEKATLLIGVPKPEIDPRLISYAAEKGYIEKPEFHISIISFSNSKKITTKFPNDPEMINKLRSLADEFTWDISYELEYAVMEKYYDEVELEKSGYVGVPEHTRRTIAQKAIVPNLAPYYEKLSILTGIEFEIPFPHLTLFSWADYEPMMNQGIGLASQGAYDKYKIEDIEL